MVENPEFALGISTLSVVAPEILEVELPVWAAILLFPVVSRLRFSCVRGKKRQICFLTNLSFSM